MKLFDTEYRIEVYDEGDGEWHEYTMVVYTSKEDAISALQQIREFDPDETYRLCELTISVKVIDV